MHLLWRVVVAIGVLLGLLLTVAQLADWGPIADLRRPKFNSHVKNVELANDLARFILDHENRTVEFNDVRLEKPPIGIVETQPTSKAHPFFRLRTSQCPDEERIMDVFLTDMDNATSEQELAVGTSGSYVLDGTFDVIRVRHNFTTVRQAKVPYCWADLRPSD